MARTKQTSRKTPQQVEERKREDAECVARKQKREQKKAKHAKKPKKAKKRGDFHSVFPL